jgi:hypothetical protein
VGRPTSPSARPTSMSNNQSQSPKQAYVDQTSWTYVCPEDTTMLGFYACLAVPCILDKTRDRAGVSLSGFTNAVFETIESRDCWLASSWQSFLGLAKLAAAANRSTLWPSFQRFSSSQSCWSYHAMRMAHLFSQSPRGDKSIQDCLTALELSISTRYMSSSVTV